MGNDDIKFDTGYNNLYVCRSGETEFRDIAKNSNRDHKLSPREVDAIIACEYGQYIPRNEFADHSVPSEKVESKEPSHDIRDAQRAAFLSRMNRTIAQDNVYFVDGSPPPVTAPGDFLATYHHFQEFIENYPDMKDSLPASTVNQTRRTFIRQDVQSQEIKKEMGHILLHETLHLAAGRDVDHWPRTLDGLVEGITEHLAINASISTGNIFHEKEGQFAYPVMTKAAFWLSKIVGEDVVAKAYFSGDLNLLIDAFNNKVGPDMWQIFVIALNRAPEPTKFMADFLNTAYNNASQKYGDVGAEALAHLKNVIAQGDAGIKDYEAYMDRAKMIGEDVTLDIDDQI